MQLTASFVADAGTSETVGMEESVSWHYLPHILRLSGIADILTGLRLRH